MEVQLNKSNRQGKKLMLIFYEKGKKKKTIHFGSSSNKDFTIYNKTEGKKVANEKKKLYLARHSPSKTKENWSVPDTPASASRWILWNLPTVKTSFNDYVKRFKLKIKR